MLYQSHVPVITICRGQCNSYSSLSSCVLVIFPRGGKGDIEENTMEVADIMVVGDIMEDTKDQEDILTGMMMKVRISAQELKEEGWTVE